MDLVQNSLKKEKAFLLYKDMLDFFESDDNSSWITIYKSIKNANEDSCIFSYCISKEFISESLKENSWDFHIGDLFSDNKKIIPLVIQRSFYDLKKSYFEISEDFRFHFNLSEDKKSNRFFYIDEDGNGEEEEAIIISENEIKIKRDILFKYLNEKSLVFIQSYSFLRMSSFNLSELKLKSDFQSKKGKYFNYVINLSENYFPISCCCVMGKKAIFSKQKKIIKKYVDFVGTNSKNEKVIFSANPNKIGNDAKSRYPNYMMPIFFKKEVLDHYLSDPDRYSVSDRYLSCGSLWSLRMDNNEHNVMVYLGDLSALPVKEQERWEWSNIEIGKISSSCFKQDFEAEFSESSNPLFYFKDKYISFQKKWQERYGWDFFLPFDKGDSHYFETLKIPSKNIQKEFDCFILALVKITIESLNVKNIKKELNKFDTSPELKCEKDEKSISIICKFLKKKHTYSSELENFLRQLQTLKSTCSSHRKGENYKKAFGYFCEDEEDYIRCSKKILVGAIEFINILDKLN